MKPHSRRRVLWLAVAIALLAVLAIVAPSLKAAEVRVAAASDLNDAIKEIISGFESTTGNKVKLTLGSSGSFYAQLSNGAPFDVFLSADVEYPRRLEAAGRTESGTIFVYATGRIVVWLPKSSRIDPGKAGLQSLLDPSIRKISIANPDHAPYGKAAIAALQRAGLYDRLRSKLVMGENVSQAAQFAESGAAQAAVIALSIALNTTMRNSGSYWEVPLDLYPRMEQAAVLMKAASPEARAFYDWIRRPQSRQILQRFGFGVQ